MRTKNNELEIAYPDNVKVISLDVTNTESIKNAFKTANEYFGNIDVLINNAGVGFDSIFEVTDMKKIRDVFETNVFGVIQTIKEIVPFFRKNGKGTILNISSSAGFSAPPFRPIYSATKHSVEGLSESLFYELASQNIKIKMIEPGFMPNTRFMTSDTASSGFILPKEYEAYYNFIMTKMMESDGPLSNEKEVAQIVYNAATDETNQLRYIAGPDAEFIANLRWSTSEKDYFDNIKKIMGHSSWEDESGK